MKSGPQETVHPGAGPGTRALPVRAALPQGQAAALRPAALCFAALS